MLKKFLEIVFALKFLFWGLGKTGVFRESSRGARTIANNKRNQHKGDAGNLTQATLIVDDSYQEERVVLF